MPHQELDHEATNEMPYQVANLRAACYGTVILYTPFTTTNVPMFEPQRQRLTEYQHRIEQLGRFL